MIRSNLEASAEHAAQRRARARHAKRRLFGIMPMTAPGMAAANFMAGFLLGRRGGETLH